MRSSWLFPPRTREVQFDEKWSFVGKKQKNCDPANSSDDHKGDWWDHVAYDPEHRLVLAVVPGARSIENAEEIVATVRDRTNGVAPQLMTSDEYPAYTSAIGLAFGVPVTEPTTGPGRRPILPARRLPQGLTYATVHKQRQNDAWSGVAVVEGVWKPPWASAANSDGHTSFANGVVTISTVGGIQQELNEAEAEQIGLNPDKVPFGDGAQGRRHGRHGRRYEIRFPSRGDRLFLSAARS